MQTTYRAIFRDGCFIPVQPCDLPEETLVEVRVENGVDRRLIPPLEHDPAKRAEIRKRVVERMSLAPLPPDAPKLTRDQLHERR